MSGNAYILLKNDAFHVIARFADAYTTGVSIVNGEMRKYVQKGTWLSSFAIGFGNGARLSCLIVTCAEAAGFERLHFGYMRTVQESNYFEDSAFAVNVQEKVIPCHGLGHVVLLAAFRCQVGTMLHDWPTVYMQDGTSTVTFASEDLDGKVTVVPPPTSWKLEGKQQLDAFTHLNLEFTRVALSQLEEASGIIAYTSNQLKLHSDVELEEIFQATQNAPTELIDLLP